MELLQIANGAGPTMWRRHPDSWARRCWRETNLVSGLYHVKDDGWGKGHLLFSDTSAQGLDNREL